MKKRAKILGAEGLCYLDRVRGRLVPATKEELVRQDTVDWLIKSRGVPLQHIRTELHLGHFDSARRADIVVLRDPELIEEGGLLVVECKKPGPLGLDDQTRRQLREYCLWVDAPWALFTNGNFTQALQREPAGRYQEIGTLPKWKGIKGETKAKHLRRKVFKRWRYEDIDCACKARAAFDELESSVGHFGEESPGLIAPVAANLFSFLADDGKGQRADSKSRHGLRLITDLGRKTREFSNSSGGGFGSDYYRSFLVRWKGAHYTISVGLIAQAKSSADSQYGTARGSTVLLVAIDEGNVSRVALELKLDKSLRVHNSNLDLLHDGRMTIGTHGGIPLDKVMAHLRKSAPDLLSNGQVLLGSIPAEKQLTWRNSGACIMNLLRYALVRDELKRRIIKLAKGS